MKKHEKNTGESKEKTKILVIDDDPIFRAMIVKAAAEGDVSVTVAGSLAEIGPMAVPKLFDVIILDYYLDNIKESLTGTDIAYALEATPILLTSSSDHAIFENEPWPSSIRKFVSKKLGAKSILREAQNLIA